ncbi:MAG: ATP-dependent helicase, partial [Acidimicrobiales bacterium]
MPRVHRHATFVPAEAHEPPGAGRLALWWTDGSPAEGASERLELVLPAGQSVRRRSVAVEYLGLADAIPVLAVLPADADVSPSMAAWAVVVKVAVDLVARGRILPTTTADGVAAWRVGPFDTPDQALLDELAAGLPPEAHALPIAGARPLRMVSSGVHVGRLVDAVADRFVRTAAAPSAGGGPFATAASGTLDATTAAWLADAGGNSGDVAHPGLRLHLPDGPHGHFAAVVQLRS